MTNSNWFARRKLLALTAGLALTTAGIGGFWQGRTTADDDNGQAAERETDRGASAQAKHEANHLSLAFRKAAEAAIPTVVTIETVAKGHVIEGRGQHKGDNPFQGENPFKGTPFEGFFNDNDMLRRGFGGRGFQVPDRQGTGSGVIVDKSGIVLTNNHVVEGADEVTVRLSDGREFTASDIKTDPSTDLAVLRIKADGSLPAARLGDSDSLQIGDWVIAVGNPFHLDSTVSAGIISSKGRELNSNKRSRFLQTDAAINPGNSGGPLVDLEGEVVGINTAIATNSGGYQGIGFAIPSNQAKWVMDQLIKSGAVRRGYLGVGIQEVEGDLAKSFGVGRHAGVAVASVMRGSPAAEAGFEEGDIILEYAGKKVRTPRELQELVERAPLDSKQQVRVLRAGQPVNLQVAVKPLPEELGRLAEVEGSRSEGGHRNPGYKSDEFGLELSDLTEGLAERLGVEGQKGVVITAVEPDSAAAEAGLREGTLILQVSTQAGALHPVKDAEQFHKLMKDASLERGVLMLCRRDGQNHFVILKK